MVLLAPRGIKRILFGFQALGHTGRSSFEKADMLYFAPMTLDSVIMLVGAVIAVLPFLGFPQRWDSVLYFLLGMIVIGLGIAVRRGNARVPKRTSPRRAATYVESKTTAPEAHDVGIQG